MPWRELYIAGSDKLTYSARVRSYQGHVIRSSEVDVEPLEEAIFSMITTAEQGRVDYVCKVVYKGTKADNLERVSV